MWRIIAFYGPLWFSFLVVLFLYWRVTSTINLYAKANKKDKVAAAKLRKLAQSVSLRCDHRPHPAGTTRYHLSPFIAPVTDPAVDLAPFPLQLRMYPVIFVCAWTVATILRIYDWWHGNMSEQGKMRSV